MDNIIEPTLNFDFANLQLGIPIPQPASNYLTRIILSNKPVFIQTPKCVTKNGFVNAGKKMYCDLMFSNEDTTMIDWMENLENKCQELLFSKGEAWFQTELTKEDIETSFSSPFKIYKSGKNYLLRVNVKPSLKIFNENNTEIKLDDINAEIHMINILEIQGIKFTTRNFQIEIELKQSMIVSPDPFLEQCFIKNNNKVIPSQQDNISQKDNISQIVNNILQTRQDALTQKPSLEIVSNSVVSVPNVKDLIEDDDEIVEDDDVNEIVEEKEEAQSCQNLANINENDLFEFDLDLNLNNLETITLQKPNHTFYNLYREAIERAKKAKSESKQAYLEAQHIKEKYMLDIESDNDSNSDFESDTDYY